MQDGSHCRTTSPLIPEEERLIERVIRKLCRGLSWRPDPELLEDCRQVARLAIWRASCALEPLDTADRARYAVKCVVREVWPVLTRETGIRVQRVEIEALHTEEGQPIDLPELCVDDWQLYFADNLGQQVERDDLARALLTLPREDYELLELAYLVGRTDEEIARLRHRTTDAIKNERQRVLARVRRRIGGG